jgi:hypothetical protein
MPSTYKLISSSTLTSSASSVTFSAIPGTYTDLVLRISARSDDSANNSNSIRLYFNGNTGTVYSFTRILSDGTTVTSYTASANGDELYFNHGINSATSTASTFSNAEIYISDYTSSSNKSIMGFQVTEKNTAASYMGTAAGLARITSAITSIEVTLNPSQSYVSNSSFYLYGIKNS